MKACSISNLPFPLYACPSCDIPSFPLHLSRYLASPSLMHHNWKTPQSTDFAACVFCCFSSPQKHTMNSGTSTTLPVSNQELEKDVRTERGMLYPFWNWWNIKSTNSSSFIQCLGTKHSMLSMLLLQQMDLPAWKKKHLQDQLFLSCSEKVRTIVWNTAGHTCWSKISL